MRLPSTTVTPVLLSFLMPLSATAAEITFAEQFSEGGIPLLIILGLSIPFLSVTIERLMHFRVNAVVLQGLMERFKPLWDAGDFAAIERLLLAEVNNITGQAAAGQGGTGGPVQGKGSGVQLSSALGRMTEFSNSDMPEEATKAYTEWGSHDFFGRGDGRIPLVDPRTMAKGAGTLLGPGGEYANRVYVNRWYLIGPFEGKHGERLFSNYSHPPEQGVVLDAAYRGKDGQLLRWEYTNTARYPLCVASPAEDAVYSANGA